MMVADIKGLDYTIANLQKLEKAGVASMATMIKGMTIQAARSAVSWSRPMPGKSYKQVLGSKKYGKRPTVKIQGRAKLKNGKPTGYTYVKASHQMFTTKKPISKKERDRRNITEVTSAVQYWNKKGNQWAYAPINPLTKKPQKRVLRSGFKIPGAGAVKAGWMHAGKTAGVMNAATPFLRSKLGGGSLSKTTGILTNEVKYGQKIAGVVPRLAERKAWKWLRHNLWLKEKAKMEMIKL